MMAPLPPFLTLFLKFSMTKSWDWVFFPPSAPNPIPSVYATSQKALKTKLIMMAPLPPFLTLFLKLSMTKSWDWVFFPPSTPNPIPSVYSTQPNPNLTLNQPNPNLYPKPFTISALYPTYYVPDSLQVVFQGRIPSSHKLIILILIIIITILY